MHYRYYDDDQTDSALIVQRYFAASSTFQLTFACMIGFLYAYVCVCNLYGVKNSENVTLDVEIGMGKWSVVKLGCM